MGTPASDQEAVTPPVFCGYAPGQGVSCLDVGPSTKVTAPAGDLASLASGPAPRSIEVTLIDFADALEPREEDRVGRTDTSVAASAVEWTANMEGDRGAGNCCQSSLPSQALSVLESEVSQMLLSPETPAIQPHTSKHSKSDTRPGRRASGLRSRPVTELCAVS